MKKLLFVSFLDASCCTRNGMCVCKCACAYIYIHAYIHISTHMYIHIHAYIYTYMDILRLEISCHMTLCVFVSITYLKMVPCFVHSKKTLQHFGGFQEIACAFCFLIICAEISHHFSKTIFQKQVMFSPCPICRKYIYIYICHICRIYRKDHIINRRNMLHAKWFVCVGVCVCAYFYMYMYIDI